MHSIEDFKAISSLNKIVITQHSRKRFAERDIGINDVQNAINSGEIIEQYPNDFPFPSCLIFGYSEGRPIHVVASIDEGFMYIISAYVPSEEKWESDLKTRKEASKCSV